MSTTLTSQTSCVQMPSSSDYLNVVLILDGPDARVVGVRVGLDGRDDRQVEAEDERRQFADPGSSSLHSVHLT